MSTLERASLPHAPDIHPVLARVEGLLVPPVRYPEVSDARALMSADECAAARPAAVLLALVARPEGLGVLLTRRTDHLARHAGQVSFAGGRTDPQDRDPVATALREAQEEIGLDSGHVRILGTLPVFLVPTGYRITPVLAWVDREPALRADPAEVAEIFYLPASLALDPDAWHLERVERAGRQHQVWALEYESRRIWGATAAILVWFGRWLRDEGVLPGRVHG